MEGFWFPSYGLCYQFLLGMFSAPYEQERVGIETKLLFLSLWP